MAEKINERITRMLLSKGRRAKYVKAFAVLAVCVVAAVALALHYNGIAMTHEEQVLACPVAGRIAEAKANGETPPSVAHTHGEGCYDEDGNLVCDLEERELHTHDDSCYTTEKRLTCGLDEGAGHTHTDECYETERKLTCGKEEITEEHVHGPGCFETVTVEDEEADEGAGDSAEDGEDGDAASDKADDKAKSTAADDKADKDADANKADDKADDADKDAASKDDDKADDNAKDDKKDAEADNKDAENLPAQSFEQAVTNAKGKEVLRVKVEAPEGAFPEGTKMEVTTVKPSEVTDAVSEAMANAGDEREVDSMEAVDIVFRDAKGKEVEPRLPITVSMTSDTIADDATSPVLVHVDDEGKGEVVDQLSDKQAAEHKVETGDDTLAFDTDEFSVYVIVYTVDFEYDVDGEQYDFSLIGGETITLSELAELLGIIKGTSFDSVNDFVAEVKDVAFSDESLVEVTQVEGDWELKSLQPFNTEESLTITMKNGDVVTIRVTDAQMKKAVIDAKGNTWEVTVTYDESAGIPDGASLEVSEITEDSEVSTDDSAVSSAYGKSYADYVSNTEKALGMEEGGAEYIRLFDIRIVDKNQKKVQPAEGSNVDVKVELADAKSDSLSVVHFDDGDENGDVLPDTVVKDEVDEGQVVEFQADGFSVYAIVDAPEPAKVEVRAVGDLEELFENQHESFYLSYGNPPKYFTNTLNGNNCFVENTSSDSASTWHFESVNEGDKSRYYIYTYDNDIKKYIKNTSGNLVGLVEEEGAIFELSKASEGKFYFKVDGQSKWLQHSNGGGGIRLWTDNQNATNSQITITYASSYALEDDVYELDGKSYGIAYHDDNVTAAALTTEGKTVGKQARLAGKDMVMKPDVLDNDGVLLVASGSDLDQWMFESVSGDKYRIKNDSKYLTLNKGALTLEDEADPTCSVFTATPGTGEHSGKWHFTVNGYSLNLPNGAANGFNGATGSGSTTWMNLVETSVLNEDDFTTYTAKKVSVSDPSVKNGQQLIIYTRIWNDTKKKYEFYAVDHDGTLIRCYDTGDNIEWVGSKVNTALWDLTVYYASDGTEENGFYEFQNTQYKDYIAPQVTDAQVFSDSPIGVNLNGRRYGDAYTTIIAWDDDNYSYAGLKAEDGKVVSCSLAEAQDFYFAIVQSRDEAEPLTPVATVDNNDYGITMKMIDFNDPADKDRNPQQTEVMGTADGGKGLLTTNLTTTGYPTVLSNNKSLSELFDSKEMKPVNHLFLQSVYNESGYFEYDSTQNFAQLNDDGDFTVYDQIGAITGNSEHKNTREHGQFMPYNNISQEKGYAYDADGKNITNQTDVLANELPDSNARKGENLYLIGNNYSGRNVRDGKGVDYFFGMEMEASFTQTASGLDAWGHDIIFEFSGDDDFWLYVDGELVIDLGGVHQAQVGSVNFRTGVITSSNGDSTLYETFKAHYTERGMSTDEVDAKLDEIFTKNDEGNYVFKDYTNHTMKVFYMERGAGASNLKMRFNLAAVRPGTFILSKELSGTEDTANGLIEFPYQVWYEDKNTGDWVTLDNTDLVHHQGTSKEVKFLSSFTPAGGTDAYSNVFFLKPGESAEVELPSDAADDKYYVTECGVNPDVYDRVTANDTKLVGTATSNTVGTTARQDYKTSEGTTDNRKSVKFTNHVKSGAMRTMEFKKKLYDADGTTELHYDPAQTSGNGIDNTTFSFRLYLANENVSEADFAAHKNSYYANLYTYHIKDKDGNYCKWDASAQRFVSLGVTTYEDFQNLAADVKEAATFTTSMHGSVSKIPAWYTVEVRGLIAGTHYMVEERDWEIPKGYTRWAGNDITDNKADGFIDNFGYARVDEGHTRYSRAPIYGTTAVGETPQLEVRNQRGWGLTVKKVWSDKDFMETHDDIYFAVYLNGELYPGTVRRLSSSETEIYYYFDDLYGFTESDQANKITYSFDQYVVKEVTLTSAEGHELVVNSDTGEVKVKENSAKDSTAQTISGDTNSLVAVTPIEEDGTLTIGGTPVGGSHQDGYTYTVSYKPGKTTGYNNNIRVDTVTNSRPGIQIYKTAWDGTTYLPEAVFTLKDSNFNDVAAPTYTSGSNGLVTIAYLNEGTYTLAEKKTPSGYVKMDGMITIKVSKGTDGKDVFEISGPQGYYTYTPASGTDMAKLLVKNRTVQELKVVKKNADDTSAVIPGAHFALYKQVKDNDGTPRPDYLPMDGYDDLVTGKDGVIPKLTMELGAGTYYLREKAAPSGYKKLSDDLCFTIGEDGTVTINTSDYAGWLKTDTSTDGVVSYEIEVQNTPLGITVKKTDEVGNPLKGAQFTLYTMDSSNEWVKESGYDLTDGKIDLTDTAELTIANVQAGRYKLSEAIAPDGYVILAKDIYFTVEDGKVTLTNESGSAKDVKYDQVSLEDDDTTIVVTNTPGSALPSTGGSGTHFYTILGFILIAGASIFLFMRRMRTFTL